MGFERWWSPQGEVSLERSLKKKAPRCPGPWGILGKGAMDRQTAAAMRRSDPARRSAAAIRSGLILAYSGLIWLHLA